ncbi:hypothetical protein M5K25_022336 [Dendrobium thyrsiflorum]|uniref:Uncharacterized protein n=1 Tax=Dendrobium thyrsiflorum TaxID=117978 RepID=A0ABD0U617_DENTH
MLNPTERPKCKTKSHSKSKLIRPKKRVRRRKLPSRQASSLVASDQNERTSKKERRGAIGFGVEDVGYGGGGRSLLVRDGVSVWVQEVWLVLEVGSSDGKKISGIGFEGDGSAMAMEVRRRSHVEELMRMVEKGRLWRREFARLQRSTTVARLERILFSKPKVSVRMSWNSTSFSKRHVRTRATSVEAGDPKTCTLAI